MANPSALSKRHTWVQRQAAARLDRVRLPPK